MSDQVYRGCILSTRNHGRILQIAGVKGYPYGIVDVPRRRLEEIGRRDVKVERSLDNPKYWTCR